MANNRLKFLIGDTAIYGFANAVSKSLALVTFPIISYNLTVSEFGHFDLALASVGFLATFIIFGQDSATVRFFYDFDDRISRQQIVSLSLFFQICLLIIALPLIFVVVSDQSTSVYLGPKYEELLILILLQVPGQLFSEFSKGVLKFTFERRKFLIITLGQSFTYGAAIASSAWLYELNPTFILKVTLVITSLFGCLGIFFISHWLAVPVKWHYFRSMFKFAVPIGIVCVAGAVFPIWERAAVSSYFGPEQLGLYSAAIKICMIYSLAHAAFQTAWGPFAMSLMHEEDAIVTFNLVAKLVSYAGCTVLLFLQILSEPLIILLAGPKFIGASQLVAPIAFSLLLNSVFMIFEIGITFSKRSYYMMVAYIISLVVLILLLVALPPSFGILSIPASVCLSTIVRVVISVYFAQIAYPLNWKYLPSLLAFSFTILVSICSMVIQNIGYPMHSLALLIITILVLLFCILEALKSGDMLMFFSSTNR